MGLRKDLKVKPDTFFYIYRMFNDDHWLLSLQVPNQQENI